MFSYPRCSRYLAVASSGDFSIQKSVIANSYSASCDNWCTVGGDEGCRVGKVRAGSTSLMPDHKGFKLQELVNFQKFSTLRVNGSWVNYWMTKPEILTVYNCLFSWTFLQAMPQSDLDILVMHQVRNERSISDAISALEKYFYYGVCMSSFAWTSLGFPGFILPYETDIICFLNGETSFFSLRILMLNIWWLPSLCTERS